MADIQTLTPTAIDVLLTASELVGKEGFFRVDSREIKKRLGKSERTIFRALQELKTKGFLINTERRNSYTISQIPEQYITDHKTVIELGKKLLQTQIAAIKDINSYYANTSNPDGALWVALLWQKNYLMDNIHALLVSWYFDPKKEKKDDVNQ